jgi:hypothetical protein
MRIPATTTLATRSVVIDPSNDTIRVRSTCCPAISTTAPVTCTRGVSSDPSLGMPDTTLSLSARARSSHYPCVPASVCRAPYRTSSGSCSPAHMVADGLVLRGVIQPPIGRLRSPPLRSLCAVRRNRRTGVLLPAYSSDMDALWPWRRLCIHVCCGEVTR